MSQATVAPRYLIDSYLDWSKGEGVPILDPFAIDLTAVETAPWPRMGDGVRGAFVHLKGRGDFVALQVIDLPPGGQTARLQHLYDEVFYVLSGRGSAAFEIEPGRSPSFEWGLQSLFSPPINVPYRLFNGSGREPARLVSATDLPFVLNLFRNERFLFDNPLPFPERIGKDTWFTGEGDFLPLAPGKHMWETNFVADLAAFEMPEWETRGVGSRNIKYILADNPMHAHTSEMPVGTYKKAHRHGAGAHVFALTGSGYTLMWYEGDLKGGEEDFERHEWKHGFVFAPPDGMFHQHFNTAPEPARYLALSLGSHRYPVFAAKAARKNDPERAAKEGGYQIDYVDQDPRIHALWLTELAKVGMKSGMGKIFDEKRILSEMAR